MSKLFVGHPQNGTNPKRSKSVPERLGAAIKIMQAMQALDDTCLRHDADLETQPSTPTPRG